jgi:thioredoxin reductase
LPPSHVGLRWNAAAHALHGFLTRDGIAPAELLRIGREQLKPYESVEIHDVGVEAAQATRHHFRVNLCDGNSVGTRKILLATGIVDVLPPIKGVGPLYGRSVFHCPYCDGWEVRDQPVAVYGRRAGGLSLARTLRGWTRDVVLCTDGPAPWSRRDQERLARYDIPVRSERIARLEGVDGRLKQVVFTNGEALPRRALFFHTGQGQRSNLAARLGCQLTPKGAIRRNAVGLTSVPGVYVAGDASREVQLAIVAAAEGVKAAFAIHKELLNKDLGDEERDSH